MFTSHISLGIRFGAPLYEVKVVRWNDSECREFCREALKIIPEFPFVLGVFSGTQPTY
jgi:hypothetical protein